jgi:hypothetical protein
MDPRQDPRYQALSKLSDNLIDSLHIKAAMECRKALGLIDELAERLNRHRTVLNVITAEVQVAWDEGVFDDWEPEDRGLIKWAFEESRDLKDKEE